MKLFLASFVALLAGSAVALSSPAAHRPSGGAAMERDFELTRQVIKFQEDVELTRDVIASFIQRELLESDDDDKHSKEESSGTTTP